MKKKLTLIVLALVFVLCLFSGCDGASAPDDPAPDPSPEVTESLPTPEGGENPSPRPEVTPTPTPEITPTPVPEGQDVSEDEPITE